MYNNKEGSKIVVLFSGVHMKQVILVPQHLEISMGQLSRQWKKSNVHAMRDVSIELTLRKDNLHRRRKEGTDDALPEVHVIRSAHGTSRLLRWSPVSVERLAIRQPGDGLTSTYACE